MPVGMAIKKLLYRLLVWAEALLMQKLNLGLLLGNAIPLGSEQKFFGIMRVTGRQLYTCWFALLVENN